MHPMYPKYLGHAVRGLAVLALPIALGGCFWVTTKAEGKTLSRRFTRIKADQNHIWLTAVCGIPR